MLRAGLAPVVTSALVVLCGRAVQAQDAADATLERAIELVDALPDLYGEIDRYSDVQDLRFEIVTGGDDLFSGMSNVTQMRVAMAYARPGKIALRSQYGSIYSDGETLWQINAEGTQYTEDRSPGEITPLTLQPDGMLSMVPAMHSLFGAVSGEPAMAENDLLGSFGDVRSARIDEVDGREVIVAEVELQAMGAMMGMGMGGGEMMLAELTLDAQTGLMHRISVDMSEAMQGEQADFGMGNVESATTVIDFGAIAISDGVDDAVFSPDVDGLERVENFNWEFGFGDDFGMGMGEGMDAGPGGPLLQDNAPAIRGRTLGGADFNLGDLRGQTVLLGFWTTWSDGAEASLGELQRLQERYGEAGLVVVGINQDVAGLEQPIQATAEGAGASFVQVLDDDEGIGVEYLVDELPTSVLISDEGIVQAYEVGVVAPGLWEERVELVLRGETIESPGAVGRMLEPIADDAVAEKNVPAPVTGWNAVSVGEGEGRRLFMPHDFGGLAEVNVAEGTVQQVELPGMPGNMSMMQFKPIVRRFGAGEVREWFVTGMEDASAVSLVRLDARGKLLWRTDIPMANAEFSDTRIAAADLNGDGSDEMIAVLEITSAQNFEHSEHWLLVVDDTSGEILTQREFDLDSITYVDAIPAGSQGPGRVVVIGYNTMAVLDYQGR